MSGKKIALIGTGFRFGSISVCDIILNEGLAGSELTLWDSNPDTLDLLYNYALLVQKYGQYEITVRKAYSLENALESQDFVILSIAVDGLEWMGRELAMAERFGVRQTVGDTVGPAGFSRAMRHLPVVMEIAHKMERICPHAIMINTTNPLTPLCTAVTKYSRIRVIGVCQEPVHVIRALCCLFNLAFHETKLEYKIWGINHFSWFTKLCINGIPFDELWNSSKGMRSRTRFVNEILATTSPLYPELVPVLTRLAAFYEYTHGRGADLKTFREQIQPLLLAFKLHELSGVLPACRPRHFIEFMPSFLNRTSNWGQQWGVDRTSVSARILFREQQRQRVREIIATEPAAFEVSDRILVRVLSAIANNKTHSYPVNDINHETDSSLPADIVIEHNQLTDRQNGSADSFKVNGALLATIKQTSASYLLLVDGLMNGDLRMMKCALLRDPNSISVYNIDELFLAIRLLNKRFLHEQPVLHEQGGSN